MGWSLIGLIILNLFGNLGCILYCDGCTFLWKLKATYQKHQMTGRVRVARER